MKKLFAAIGFALLLTSCGGCPDDGPLSIALPPPFEPVPPALEEAPPPSPKLVDHPALSEVPKLAAGWFADSQQRTVYVQLDKPLYRPGEAVWVKSWSLSQQGLTGAIGSRPIEYRLIGPRGETVETKRIKESGGTATNDFQLTGASKGGTWHVQVLTGDIVLGERRFVVANYQAPRFRKELEFLQKAYGPGDEVAAAFSIAASGSGPLVNQRVTALVTVDGVELPPLEGTTDANGELTLGFSLPAELSAGRGLLTVMVDDGGDVESIARPIPIKLSDLRLGFFPEGGDLIAGLPSRLYFEGRDRFDEPADVAGIVEDYQGHEVAEFESLHDGLGRFDFTPEVGRRYRARLSRPAGLESETFPLPTAQAAGCVLRTFDDPAGERASLRASVRCSDPRDVLVVGAQRGQFLGFAAVKAGPDAPGIVHLDPSDPGLARARGLARVTVLDEDLTPLAERLFFRNWRRGLQVTVEPDRVRYGPRDSVTLTVTTRDHDGQPVPAEVAVSVVDDAVLKLADDTEGNLLSAVLLEGELPGEIEKPQFYFDAEEDDAAAMLELLVGARGWRRFAAPSPGFDVVDEAPAEGVAGADKAAEEVPRLDPVAEPAPSAAQSPMDPPSRRPPAARPSRVEEEASSKGLLELIGTTGQGGDGGADASDLFSDAGGLSDDIDAALRGSTGSSIDRRDVELSRRGQGGVADIGEAGGSIGGMGTRSEPARPSREARVRMQDFKVLAGASDYGPALHRTLKRYTGRFRRCYERQLLSNPTLAGEVRSRVTVTVEGRVASALVEVNSTGSNEVGLCVERELKRARFNPPPGDPTTFSTRFLFASEDGAMAYRPPPSRSSPPRRRVTRPRFAAVREFPKPRHSADYSGPRTDFRDTLLWAPRVITDATGIATATFPLSDAVATFTVSAEAASQGDLGRGEAEIATQLPFSMSVKLPAEVSAGDRLRLPVSLTSGEPVPVNVSVACDLGELLTEGDRPGDVVVPAEGKARLFIPIEVGDGSASTRIAVTADAEGLQDAETRELIVVPRGFPRASHRSGQLKSTAKHTIELEPELQSVRAKITFHPDPLSSLEKGMAAMIREPHGCFEQVASANYPNVLVLRYLQARGKARPGTVRKARSALEHGYARMAGYEVSGGGFDWYGRAPAHEELTAYGLLQFADMRRVHKGIDGEMLGRAGAWLKTRSDGRGGFLKAARAWKFRGASESLRTAYITYGVASAGAPVDPQALAHSASLARKSGDPYLLALASSTLMASPGKESAGRSAAGRLTAMQGEDGAWLGAVSITNSGEYGRRVESTALAVLALSRAGGHGAEVDRGVQWLNTNRQGARWGSTQSTILALRALVAVSEANPPLHEPANVTVLVNGEVAGSARYDSTTSKAIVIRGLEKHMISGSNRIELKHSGKSKLPYALSVRSRSRQPADHPQAPLKLSTSLSRAQVPLGEPVRADATVVNTSGEDVANPLIRIGLPAGLTAQPWQLEKMRDELEIAAFETMGRDVVIYLDGMRAGETKKIGLDLLAEIPGTTTGPASTVYPYYSDDERTWAPELSIEVLGGQQGPPMPIAPRAPITPAGG